MKIYLGAMNELPSAIRVLVSLLSILLLAASTSTTAKVRPIQPTIENLAGRWTGIDSVGHVWRLHLEVPGRGAVAYATGDDVHYLRIRSIDLDGRHIRIIVEGDHELDSEELIGEANVVFLKLRLKMARRQLRLQREERIVSELVGTTQILEEHGFMGDQPTVEKE